jgi:hypothetical protein
LWEYLWLALLLFLVVCSSDTYAPIKPVKQVAYQPHEAYSKTQTKQEGSKKVDIKVIPKVRRFGGENGQFRYNRASNA